MWVCNYLQIESSIEEQNFTKKMVYNPRGVLDRHGDALIELGSRLSSRGTHSLESHGLYDP